MTRFISISGTIGAGKTELAKLLVKLLDANFIKEEFAENTFLPKFYENPERYAFPLEISFLFERFQQLKVEFSKTDIFKQLYISDYLFDKTILFAKNNLSNDQYKVFKSLYDPFYEQIRKPDLVLFIHRPVEVLLENIQKRGRNFEKSIDGKYLQDIQDLYLSYFKYSNDKKVVVLKLEDRDFINNENLLNKIIDLINQNHIFGTSYFGL
jgi:deoxyguanosine kinase